MQVVRAMLVVAVALVFTGAAKADAKEDIVGKWEMKEKIGDKEIVGTFEFTKDNKMTVAFMGIKFEGTYKILSETKMEVTIEFMGNKQTETNEFKVTKETLELTDKGKTQKLKRIK